MSVLKTTMLLGTMTGLLLVIGLIIGGFWGMTFALAVAVVVNMFAYWYSDRIVLRMHGAKPLERKDIEEMAAKISHEAKIPRPRLYLISKNTPNAFATGRNPRNSAVALTEGLLKLDNDEIEGVLAHEIAHIKNRDVLISTMAATLGGAIAYIAHIGYWSLFFGGGGRRDQGNMVGLLLIIIFAPIAALLVRMAISRSEEYRADRTGALLTKNPKGLASALRKISREARRSPSRGGSSATSHMWIVNPFKNDWFTGLFSTHPPIEKRIERLYDLHPE